MGLTLMRWWHLRQARGNVLEVGCGTGRNFSYYDESKVTKVTAVDSVPAMLMMAMKKGMNSKLNIGYDEVNTQDMKKFSDNSFDTVVDTFGLCSYEDPVQALKEMSRVCKKNGEGKILLIEHGKGTYDWINRTLDRGAQHHACSWGCIWNRDINHLLDAAGLKVTNISRWHFGTTYLIEAEPANIATSSVNGVVETGVKAEKCKSKAECEKCTSCEKKQ